METKKPAAINFECEENDLLILFSFTKFAYPSMNFDAWCNECKACYSEYLSKKIGSLTFSQYVNKQIINLT